jgi:hypothetical protein
LAIDLNPVQNPYVQFQPDGRAVFSPAAGASYANRLNVRPGKPMRQGMAEEVVELFADHGFLVWGGNWDAPLDYQHFQVERSLAERMAQLPVQQAQALFKEYVHRFRSCLKNSTQGTPTTARVQCIEKQTQ